MHATFIETKMKWVQWETTTELAKYCIIQTFDT